MGIIEPDFFRVTASFTIPLSEVSWGTRNTCIDLGQGSAPNIRRRPNSNQALEAPITLISNLYPRKSRFGEIQNRSA